MDANKLNESKKRLATYYNVSRKRNVVDDSADDFHDYYF